MTSAIEPVIVNSPPCKENCQESPITAEPDLPALLRGSLLQFCQSVEWRKTTTYPPHLEHEYILCKNHPEIFAGIAKVIDDYGHDESFYGTPYRYLILDGYRYWHFDTLVNRETMEKYLARHSRQVPEP